MKIKEAIRWGVRELKDITSRPRLEVEILLSYILGVKREFIILNDNKEVDEVKFKELINRRKNYEPIEYIIKRVSFWDFELFIDRGALIPRPESEILVQKALELIKEHNIKRVAEIGIGSGALSIAIAKESSVIVEASDISKEAIEIAKINIKKFNLEDKIKIKHTSLLNSLKTPELLISNPPYIDRDFKLDKNIFDYEPHTALFANNKGLEILFKILDLIKEKKIPFAVCEMGYNQKEAIRDYAKSIKLEGKLEFYKDLASFDRGFIYKNYHSIF